MVTPLGKVLRIIRINCEETSSQMAKKLHISPSYLSSIETGNRKIPYDLFELIMASYKLTPTDVNRLKIAIIESSDIINFKTKEYVEYQKQILFKLYKKEINENDAQKMLESIEH